MLTNVVSCDLACCISVFSATSVPPMSPVDAGSTIRGCIGGLQQAMQTQDSAAVSQSARSIEQHAQRLIDITQQIAANADGDVALQSSVSSAVGKVTKGEQLGQSSQLANDIMRHGRKPSFSFFI